MERDILIISFQQDLHAQLVEEALRARGARVFRLDLDRFPRDYRFDFRISASGQAGGELISADGASLRLDAIGAIWTRKTAAFAFADTDMGVQEEAYARAETEHALFSMLMSLDCYWMSHPLAIRAALWKGEQLIRAARHGFSVPDTLIGNQPASVRAFRMQNEDDIIFKTMASADLGAELVAPEDRLTPGLPTTRITDDHDAMLDAVAAVPCLFQRHVRKQHELRVTVIGDEIFVARIHSQDDARTSVDFRNIRVPIRYEAATLSPDLQRRCIEFVHSYGLVFGAIDLIETPEGTHVFLENNPVGQFLFVERLVPDLKMLDAITTALIDGASSRTG